MISVGIDSGSATTKAVLVIDGRIAANNIRPTGFDFYQPQKMGTKTHSPMPESTKKRCKRHIRNRIW